MHQKSQWDYSTSLNSTFKYKNYDSGKSFKKGAKIGGIIILHTIEGLIVGFILGATIGYATGTDTEELRRENYALIYGGFGAIPGGIIGLFRGLAKASK